MKNAIREMLYVVYGDSTNGFRPGSFGEALINAFGKADSLNFARLSVAFPEYGDAATLAKGGREALIAALKD